MRSEDLEQLTNPEPSNHDRAERAQQALSAYPVAGGPEETAQDLITDCLHLLHLKGASAESLRLTLNMAISNFEAESDIVLGRIN